MRAYLQYKLSCSPFPREIPQHWEETTLFRAYSLKNVDNVQGEDLLSVFLDRGVICYSSTSPKQVHKPSEDMSKYQLVEPGDFVVNNQQAWRGSVGVSKYRGIISPAYYIWSPRQDYNPYYMNYMLRDKDVIDQFVLASKGVGSIQRQIYVPYMKTTVLAIPPRSEQDQIVRFLDWKVSQIDKLVHGYKRQINLLEERKRVLAFNAAVKGISPSEGTKRSSIYWLSEIPRTWEEKTIGQVFLPVKHKNDNLVEQNLLSLSYGAIKRRDINATDGLLPESFEGYNIVEKDDIVLRLTDLQNDQRSLRTGIVVERGIITSAYLTLRNNSGNLPQYLHYFLHAFDLAKGFYNVGASGVRQSLNWDAVKALKILIPPLSEQYQIVSYVETESAKVEMLKQEIQQNISLLQEYRTRLISDVVTGQIDVRDVVIPGYTAEDYAEDSEDTDENEESEVTEDADEC